MKRRLHRAQQPRPRLQEPTDGLLSERDRLTLRAWHLRALARCAEAGVPATPLTAYQLHDVAAMLERAANRMGDRP